MIKYNNKTINEWYFDSKNIIKVYKNNAVCYYKIVSGGGTPSQEPCFAVVEDITQYSDTEFIDVYDKTTEKWYKLNNLNQYEQYGIYGEGRNITYYDGKLTIDNGYEYEWDGSQWDNLGEVSGSSVPDSYVIPFDDSTVKNICVTNWGGNVVAGEITYGEAKAVTSLGSVFKGNSTIRKFNELAYFHGLTSLANGEFQSCTNLTDIVIPSNVTTLGNSSNQNYVPFRGCSLLSGLTILSSSEAIYIDQIWGDNSYWQNTSHKNVPMIFPNRPITLGWTFGYADNLENVYFQYSTPPANLANADIARATKLKNTYVPIGSYSAYNAVLSSYNKTVIEYDFETDSLGLLDKEKEWIAKTSSVIVYPKYYTEKDEPENDVVFTDMTEALAYECPWVGQNATISGVAYVFTDSYQWEVKYVWQVVAGSYLCVSGDKYQKLQKYERSGDGTLSPVVPAQYMTGDLIEAGSSDCEGGLPDVAFTINYNAKEYIANTKTLPKTYGQLADTDAVISGGTPTVGNGYLTIETGTRAPIIGYQEYFNCDDNNPNITIIAKVYPSDSSTFNGCHLFANRESNYNWMLRTYNNKLTLHGNSEQGQIAITDRPAIVSVRVDSNRLATYNNWTDQTSSTKDNFSYGSTNSSGTALFAGYLVGNNEWFQGDFYWIYMSQTTLTDEQIQQVIDYNENL